MSKFDYDSIVLGKGPKPNNVMLVGEAPGAEEYISGRPFVGRSGQDLQWYFDKYGLYMFSFFVTNLIKEYKQDNPDPSPEDIEKWGPVLMKEIEECNPSIIITLGAFSTRYFLGSDADLFVCHGIPHIVELYGKEVIILPTYHPAYGLYLVDEKSKICADIQVAAKLIKGESPNVTIVDTREENKIEGEYKEVTGSLKSHIDESSKIIALDTEGSPSRPWSIQVSSNIDSGYTILYNNDGFSDDVYYLQGLFDNGAKCVLHNALYDIRMSLVMGLDLRESHIVDTTYIPYFMNTEPQGLKALAYRLFGCKNIISYRELIQDIDLLMVTEYLMNVEKGAWDYPGPFEDLQNDGSIKKSKPWNIQRRAKSLLDKIVSDKPISGKDIRKTWKEDVRDELKEDVEHELGKIPYAHISDVDFDRAIEYASRDAQVTLMVYEKLIKHNGNMFPKVLLEQSMKVLPAFEEMNATGLPIDVRYFVDLEHSFRTEMSEYVEEISTKFRDGENFNPNSSQQVRQLLEDRGLVGLKMTDGGDMSTAKSSIAHLAKRDKSIELVFKWREVEHLVSSFCAPVFKFAKNNRMKALLKPTRTYTRRLAAGKPNSLAIPIRTEKGKLIRAGYRYPEGSNLNLIACDLSQIEVRILAHVSGDRLLRKIYTEERDYHTETACFLFGVDDPTSNQRDVGKTINFLMQYGGSGNKAYEELQAKGINMPLEDCLAAVDAYWDIYKGAKEYKEELCRQVKAREQEGVSRHHYKYWPCEVVFDMWGMPRAIPYINHHDPSVRAEGERKALSHCIQGGAQGLIQNSMTALIEPIRNLQKQGYHVKWCLQVHDEVVLEVEDRIRDLVIELVLDALENRSGLKMSIPIKASSVHAKNWGDLK